MSVYQWKRFEDTVHADTVVSVNTSVLSAMSIHSEPDQGWTSKMICYLK